MLVGRVIGLALLIALCGCSARTGYYRSGLSEPGELRIDDERVEVNKINFIRFYGPPTFVVQLPDGEACIWRNLLGARFGDDGDWDFIVTFDKDGNVVPTDLNADYGLCNRCGCDLQETEATKCPKCGRPV